MSLLKPRERRRFRLLLPSKRTAFATLIVYAVGFILSLVFMFIEKNERVFWDLISLTIGAILIIFIGSYIADYIEQA